ncbi:MAG: hypothetical protein AAGF12_35565 [Myxococcota bacterium]
MGKTFVVWVGLMSTIGLSAGSALAQDTQESAIQLRPSTHYSYGGGESDFHSFGVGLEYRHYIGQSSFRLGGFANAEQALGESFADGLRTVGGMTFGFRGFGLELGLAHRTAADGFAATTGIHIGKTFTMGPIGIGGRITLPIHDSMNEQDPTMQTHGIELGFVVSLGWSFNVRGQPPRHRGHHHCRGRR